MQQASQLRSLHPETGDAMALRSFPKVSKELCVLRAVLCGWLKCREPKSGEMFQVIADVIDLVDYEFRRALIAIDDQQFRFHH